MEWVIIILVAVVVLWFLATALGTLLGIGVFAGEAIAKRKRRK